MMISPHLLLNYIEVLELTIAINPVPCPRPRVSKWGAYYPKTYTTFKKDAVALVKGMGLNKIESQDIVIEIDHAIEKPKTTKRVTPRGDFDNYAKSTCDVLTSAGVWEDDDTVSLACVTKRFIKEGEKPHIRVKFYAKKEN